MAKPRALIECVPNFSEGRDPARIERIADTIRSVEGVRLLDTDPGKATNRTVMTFVGAPEDVVEAAYRAIRAAAEAIDLRRHTGEHPRMGATDVCPLVPISGIEMAETAEWARRLGRRVGDELGIPVYLYEAAASRPDRRNLATIRAGEFEGLAEKMADPDWAPDFGPSTPHPTAGATVIGARDFLVAYNINLNTTSTRRANAVAFDLREQGRVVQDPTTGKPAVDASGEPLREPGRLKGVKGIGWFIPEYGIAQVSLNLTDLAATPLHVAFDAACDAAAARGLRVTGSELIGLIPLDALLAAGRHYLAKQSRSLGVDDRTLVHIAVKSLGLDDLAPFDPQAKIIEHALARPDDERLVRMAVRDLVAEAASESPAPGGGSVAGVVGALGAAMGAMVANLSAGKRGWDDRWAMFSDWAERGQAAAKELLWLVDEDTRAFDDLLAAMRLPKDDTAALAVRAAAIEAATQRAIDVPLSVIRTALGSMDLMLEMAAIGLPSSISDAGVGALCARTAVRAAALNVRINVPGLTDAAFAAAALAEAAAAEAAAAEREIETLRRVEASIQGTTGG
ncbi:MAG: glutamate formimidoyltransferase [Ardenticatenales bacterium]|nr:glutamate formimidoyltransferase [Ardenticatenales bacterium]